MKTLKKLFSVSAIVALLGTLAPMYAFGATYTAELEEAYNYAYKNGITTMTSIDNANMFGSLTRIAMAKMIANYATTVLGLEPDTSAKCTFTDVTAALDAQYDNGVTKACQLGLMGQNITAFRPNDPVTRAEFGTTLSRALNSNDADKLAEMNAADPYYKEHLNFLKNEGIMTQIDNPSMTEVRGYVMLMMMRADESYTPVEGCTAEELLACVTADDYDACIAACSDTEEPGEEEEGNGLVTISKVSAAATQEVAQNASKKNVGTIKLKAGEDGAIVSSVVVKRNGLGSNNVSVQLTNKDGTITTTARTVNSNGEATVRFSPALQLKANESMNLDVLVNLLAGVGANETHNFEVIGANLANGKAEGSAVLGSLRTTSYTVAKATAAAFGGVTTMKAGEISNIAQVTLTLGTKAAEINGFTLSKGTTGTFNIDFDKAFSDVKAYYNNKEIGKVTMTSDRIIVSGLEIEKEAGESVVITLKANGIYIGTASDTSIGFGNAADVDIVEKDTKEAVQLNTPLPAEKVINLTAVNLTMTKVSTGDVTVAPSASNIILYNAKIESTTEFDVIGYTLEVDNSATLTDFTNGTIVLNVDGNPIELVATDFTTNVATFTSNDYFTVTPSKAVSIKVTATATSTATNSHWFRFKLTTLRDPENSSNTINVAENNYAVKGNTTTIGAGTLTLKAATVAAPTSTNIWANGTDLEVARFGLKATAENITVNKVIFTEQGTYDDYELTSLISSAKLVNVKDDTVIASNGKIVNASCSDNTSVTKAACTAASKTWTDGYIEFDGITLTAEKDVDTNVKVLIDTNSFNADGTNVKFNTVIDPADTSRESVGTATVTGSPLAGSKTYTVNIISPKVTLTKLSDSVFKVTVENKDGNSSLWLGAVSVRVKAVADNGTYAADYYLREEGSNVTTPATLLAYAADVGLAGGVVPGPITQFVFGTTDGTDVAPIEIAKNSSYSFEVYVDSNYVNPTTLMAEVSALTYATTSAAIDTVAEFATATTENYDVSAQ